AESPRERQFMIKVARITWTLVGLVCLAVFSFVFLNIRDNSWWNTHPVAITTAFISVGFGYAIALMALILWTSRTVRRIRREEAAKLPTGALPRAHKWAFQPFEYRSRWTLLGLPLIHIRMECMQDGKTLPAKGWTAVAKMAYGVLFGFAGVAVGTVAWGAFPGCWVPIGGWGAGWLGLAGLPWGA